MGEPTINQIVEPLSCAMRGRSVDNPSDRTAGIPTEQRLEIGGEVANCLTSVQKDSIVVEPCILGYTRDDKGNVTSRHEKEIAGTLHTSTGNGGNTDQFVKEPSGCYDNQFGEFARVPLEGVTRTLKADHHNAVMLKYRIRKLCPIETERLMGLTDEDFYKMANAKIPQVLKSGGIKYKPMPRTALYRLHGNSIVVDVLYHIFRCMFIPNQPEYDEPNKSIQQSLFPDL